MTNRNLQLSSNDNMLWFMFVFVYYVLSYSTLLVTGQCTVSSRAVSLLGSEESLLNSLKEHDNRMQKMIENMCSAFERVEATVNRSIARGQEEHFQTSKTQYYNTSVNLERSGEKISSTPECLNTREQKEYLSSMNSNLSSAMRLMKEQLSAGLGSMNESVVGAWREHDQKLQTMNEALSSAINSVNEKLNAILNHVNVNLQHLGTRDNCWNNPAVCDCSEIKANGHTISGVYRIYVVDQSKRYYVTAYCDMTTANRGWTVFQRRKDGSVDFYREWRDYENGFGNPSGEFWLGNDFLHLLTSKKNYRIRIDLEDFEGETRFAEYSTFSVSSSADKYRLTVSGFSGNAGDSLSIHNGHQFTTKDNDNDGYARNCAVDYRGAWWYQNCHQCNLNGLYLRGRYPSSSSFNGYEGVRWRAFYDQWYSLKTTEMKISSS